MLSHCLAFPLRDGNDTNLFKLIFPTKLNVYQNTLLLCITNNIFPCFDKLIAAHICVAMRVIVRYVPPLDRTHNHHRIIHRNAESSTAIAD